MANILVVDDIEDNRRLLEFDLEDDDHRVLLAASGVEALSILDAERVDLMLLDVNMPGMSGTDVLRELKKDPLKSQLPVIMVTANDLDDEVVHALDLGANDYVTKPYSYAVLSARMRTSLRLKHSQDNLEEANRRLEILATTDALTGLYNRRHFFDLSNKEISKSLRHERSMIVAMIDVDHFKPVNDLYGHDAGDRVLKELSVLMKNCFRSGDIVARVGGEEFAICMPDTDVEAAMTPCQRLRESVEQRVFTVKRAMMDVDIKVTLSIGIAQINSADNEISQMLRRADLALYQAKDGGRNQIVVD
jgi:diguanylate cyclase (GGDEF)-like protein